MEPIIIKDNFLIRLKLFEILLPVLVGGVILSLMKPEEYTSPAALPLFGVTALVFLDGLFGFPAAVKGIEIDPVAQIIRFPHWYSRKTVRLSEVREVKSTYKISRDQQFRTHYTYYVELYGDFGKKKLTFKSEESRNQVFKIVKGLMVENR